MMAPPTVKAGHSKHKPHPVASRQALQAPSKPPLSKNPSKKEHPPSSRSASEIVSSSKGSPKVGSGSKESAAHHGKPATPGSNNTGQAPKLAKHTRHKQSKQSRKAKITDLQRSIAQLKVDASSQNSDIQKDVRNIFWNPTASTREIVFKFVDFFDSPELGGDISLPFAAFQQYKFDLGDVVNWTDNAVTSAAGARVLRYRLYALPEFKASFVVDATRAVLFGLPVRVGNGGANVTVATKTTVLTPTSVSDWVLVGEWDEATITSTSNQLLGDGQYAILGTHVLVDADDFEVPLTIGDGNNIGRIQYMAEITVAQALPVAFNIQGGPSESSANGFTSILPGDPSAQAMMAEAVSTRKTE